MKLYMAAVFTLVLGSMMIAASPTPAPKPTPGPKNAQGLTAEIVANKDTYTLDPAISGKEFKDRLEAMKNARGGRGLGGNRLPTPPAVDLTLKITNTTDKDVTISLGGDDSRLELKLTGPSAITVDNNVAMTMEFRMGKPVVIAPGKSHEIKITSLAFGIRGISQHAYWTEPGEYTLVATQVYGFGETQGRVESGPAKLKVEAAK